MSGRLYPLTHVEFDVSGFTRQEIIAAARSWLLAFYGSEDLLDVAWERLTIDCRPDAHMVDGAGQPVGLVNWSAHCEVAP